MQPETFFVTSFTCY